MRTKIKQSNDKKEKDTMYIWLTNEDKADKEIHKEIEGFKTKYRVVTFESGNRDPRIFLRKFLEYADIRQKK